MQAQLEQRRLKRLFLWSCIGLVILLTLLFQLSPTISIMLAQEVADQAVQTVLIKSSAFDPAEVTVSQGTTVEWVNQDSTTHTVTSQTGLWDSGDIAPGAVYSRTFDTAGSYPYRCTYHPTMTGTVIVVAKNYLPIVVKNFPSAIPTGTPPTPTYTPTSTPTDTPTPTATPTSTPTATLPPCPQTGSWTGTTNQGRPISFTVSNTSGCQVQDGDIEIRVWCDGGCWVTVKPAHFGPASISNDHFEDYTHFWVDVIGDFTSDTAANGDWISSFTDPFGCGHCAGSGTWTASYSP